jgi:hypothetical protein
MILRLGNQLFFYRSDQINGQCTFLTFSAAINHSLPLKLWPNLLRFNVHGLTRLVPEMDSRSSDFPKGISLTKRPFFVAICQWISISWYHFAGQKIGISMSPNFLGFSTSDFLNFHNRLRVIWTSINSQLHYVHKSGDTLSKTEKN